MLNNQLRRLPPAAIALFVQLLAFVVVSVLFHTAGAAPGWLSIIASGIIAALMSQLAGLALWWLLIQLMFLPALYGMLKLNIPPGFFLLAFLFMLLVYWSTFRTQVPLYLSSKRAWQTLDELLPPAASAKTFNFADIGSGMGGVVSYLAKLHPLGRFTGIESAPLPYWFSALRTKLGKQKNCTMIWDSFWTHDLSKYEIVYAYLSPVPMEKLWLKVQKEMRPGSLFVSNTFLVPQKTPDYSITLDDLQHSTLHVWQI